MCVPGWWMEGGGQTLVFNSSFLSILESASFSVYLSERTTDTGTPEL